LIRERQTVAFGQLAPFKPCNWAFRIQFSATANNNCWSTVSVMPECAPTPYAPGWLEYAHRVPLSFEPMQHDGSARQ
jgi:hypothetical protein